MAVTWPTGASSAGVACGIKRSGTKDLGLLLFEEPVPWAGVFTRNGAAAAPVQWCRARAGDRIRALVVNSGNANACTGPAGDIAVSDTAAHAAKFAGGDPRQVLVSSTGPIGVPLPVELITGALDQARAQLSDDVESFAEAILTTDSGTKLATADAGGAKVVGVAKGAAMVHPNMATMLAFIVTDASCDSTFLQEMLSNGVDRSFNRISIDGCESTNDSVFLFCTEQGPQVDPALLGKAVEEVCSSLAEQIVADAEGATKLVRIRVAGSSSDRDAAELGRAVASSDLWRAAVFGSDPNWGRIVAALGTQQRDLDLSALQVSIGETRVFDGGPTGALAVMSGPEVSVTCVVGSGPGRAEVLSCDLTTEYVRLNAEGSS